MATPYNISVTWLLIPVDLMCGRALICHDLCGCKIGDCCSVLRCVASAADRTRKDRSSRGPFAVLVGTRDTWPFRQRLASAHRRFLFLPDRTVTSLNGTVS
eukprot:1048489-Prymnesium_polylepis.1